MDIFSLLRGRGNAQPHEKMHKAESYLHHYLYKIIILVRILFKS